MTRARSVWILTVMCFGVGLVMASLTTLYSIGPDLAGSIGASTTELTWIIDAYTLVIAALLLPAGAIGDRYGRREVMLVGTVVFVVAAAAMQVVDTPTGLIAVRAVMGIGGALILPATLSIITTTFPADFRARAIGIWTAAWVMAGAAGMLLAGILLEIADWHATSWSTLVGGLIFLAVGFTVPTSRDDAAPPVDVAGSAAVVVSMSALVYGLIEAGMRGWGDPLIVGAFGVALVAGAVFVAIELRRDEPMLDVRVFTERGVGAASLVMVMSYAAAYGAFFLIMQFQQYVLGFEALKAVSTICLMGITILPLTLAMPWISRRLDLRALIAIGCVSLAVAFWLLAQVDSSSTYTQLGIACLVMGVGMGLTSAPCTDAILDNVPVEQHGVGASVNHTTRELGTALGVALFGGLISASYVAEMREPAASLPDGARTAVEESVVGALAVADQSGPAGLPLAEAAREAFTVATQHTSGVMAVIMIVTAVVATVWAPSARRLIPIPRPGIPLRRRPSEHAASR